MPPLSTRLVHDIRSAHLKQLAQLQPPPPGKDPKKAPTDVPDLLPMLLGWVQANPSAILAAYNSRKILPYRFDNVRRNVPCSLSLHRVLQHLSQCAQLGRCLVRSHRDYGFDAPVRHVLNGRLMFSC